MVLVACSRLAAGFWASLATHASASLLAVFNFWFSIESRPGLWRCVFSGGLGVRLFALELLALHGGPHCLCCVSLVLSANSRLDPFSRFRFTHAFGAADHRPTWWVGWRAAFCKETRQSATAALNANSHVHPMQNPPAWHLFDSENHEWPERRLGLCCVEGSRIKA